MPTNRTHRARLARALAAVTDTPYQTALAQVVTAADNGRLPTRLDPDGMRQALDILLADTRDTAANSPVAADLQPRYYQLRELPGMRLQPAAAAQIDAARTRGVAAARSRGNYDPVGELGALGFAEDDTDLDTDWWRRIVAGGARDDLALPCPYPPGTDPDGYLPIDRALEEREDSGDVDAYEKALHAIVRDEPRDIDAHAHLGHLHLALADPANTELVITPEPTRRQRQAWLRTALGHYQAGVGIGELALPDPFTGVLVWSELDNRPFHRALHGLALALWRLTNFAAAELVLHNMLWLNPLDNQGARTLLPAVHAGIAWEDSDDR